MPDDWINAPEPEEVSRKKKEEDERIKKEKEDAAEAKKMRKQAIKEEKNKQKNPYFDVDNDNDKFDESLFEVEKEQAEISYLHDAINAFGDLNTSIKNIDKIDIGEYIPETVEQFNSYAEEIVKKINQIFPEIKQGKEKKEYEQIKSVHDNNIVNMIEYLIIALCDNYQSPFLEDLNANIIELYNKKLDEYKKCKRYKKKSKHNTNTFFNDAKENSNIDEIV